MASFNIDSVHTVFLWGKEYVVLAITDTNEILTFLASIPFLRDEVITARQNVPPIQLKMRDFVQSKYMKAGLHYITVSNDTCKAILNDSDLPDGFKEIYGPYRTFLTVEGVRNILWYTRRSKTYFREFGSHEEEAVREFNTFIEELLPNRQIREPRDVVRSNHEDNQFDALSHTSSLPSFGTFDGLNDFQPDVPLGMHRQDPFIVLDGELIENPLHRKMGAPRKPISTRMSITECANILNLARSYIMEPPYERDLFECLSKVMRSRDAKKHLPQNIIHASAVCSAQNTTMIEDSYIDITKNLMPELWKYIQARDYAYVSYESYHELRKCLRSQATMFPSQWLKTYQKYLNQSAVKTWDIRPKQGEKHEVLTEGNEKEKNIKNKPLTLDTVVYVSLKEIIKSHICRCILAAKDMRSYLRSNDIRQKLIYKLTFDTTQTAGGDFFMMGLIPQTVPITKKLQSADNVYILSLVKMEESLAIITKSIPTLQRDIEEIIRDGLELELLDNDEALVFEVDIHIAADLKALWIALGLINFSCPFCIGASKADFNKINEYFELKQLEPIFGISSEKIHLCALHAELRIVERLLKCAAVSARGQDMKENADKKALQKTAEKKKSSTGVRIRPEKKSTTGSKKRNDDEIEPGDHDDPRKQMENGEPVIKVKKLSRIKQLEKAIINGLKRRKFKIVGKSKQVNIRDDSQIDFDEEEDLEQSLEKMGYNVTGCYKDVYMKLSALTGVQSRQIMTNKTLRTKILEISEDKCWCKGDERTKKVKFGNNDSWSHKCRRCIVELLWDIFAEKIHPLLTNVSVPEDIQEAIRLEKLEEKLEEIRILGKDWLNMYLYTYGNTITPYVHIIGTHLADMLAQEGHSIGFWCQQGFEAAHKVVRKVYRTCTSQGGGQHGKSPLLQIMEHMYRRHWAAVRELSEHKDPMEFDAECIVIRERVKKYMKKYVFHVVDEKYLRNCTNSQKDAMKYVQRKATAKFKKMHGIRQVSLGVIEKYADTLEV